MTHSWFPKVFERRKIRVREQKEGKRKWKRKAKLGIHLIKANHGITEGWEPLTMLPQIFLVSLVEAFIQPMDRKAKMKRKMSTTVRDIRKSTLRIVTQFNIEKFLFVTSTPRICHKALPGDRLVTLDAHNPLFFFAVYPHRWAVFPYPSGGRPKGSIEVKGSSLTPRPWLGAGTSEPTTLGEGFMAWEEEKTEGCQPDAALGPRGALDLGERGRLLKIRLIEW